MKEARLKEAEIITAVHNGEVVPKWEKPKQLEHLTFDEVYKMWFEVYKQQDLTNSTISLAQSYFEKHLLKPELFGGMYLERMSRMDIQQRLNKFMPKYVHSHIMVSYAKRVLKWAVDNEEIAFNDNPLDHVTLAKSKKAEKRETRYYTEEQAKRFEAGIREYWGKVRPDLVALFTVLLRTGARIG